MHCRALLNLAYGCNKDIIVLKLCFIKHWNLVRNCPLSKLFYLHVVHRLASDGILGKEREPGVGKLNSSFTKHFCFFKGGGLNFSVTERAICLARADDFENLSL